MSVHVIFPARMASQRLPRKALADIHGMPMVIRPYQQVQKAKLVKSIVIATDHQDIVDAAKAHGANVVMTSVKHNSGTDRIAEVISGISGNYKDSDIIINVQGDEPLIPPVNIDQVASNLLSLSDDIQIATLCTPVEDLPDILNPNYVKVVFDNNKLAMYFSRAPIPYAREFFPDKIPDGYNAYRHIGLYAYRCGFFKGYAKLVNNLDKNLDMNSNINTDINSNPSAWESLEQLKFMQLGFRIHVDIAAEVGPPGIDTQSDLDLMQMAQI